MTKFPDNKKFPITFWLCDSDYQQLNATVDRTGLTRSDYLRLLIWDALNQGVGVSLVPHKRTDLPADAPNSSTVTLGAK